MRAASAPDIGDGPVVRDHHQALRLAVLVKMLFDICVRRYFLRENRLKMLGAVGAQLLVSSEEAYEKDVEMEVGAVKSDREDRRVEVRDAYATASP